MQHDDLTESSNNNVQSKVFVKGNMMTGSSSNVQSKVFFKGNMMTGSSSNNFQSKVSFKGSTMAGSSNSNVESRAQYIIPTCSKTTFWKCWFAYYLHCPQGCQEIAFL